MYSLCIYIFYTFFRFHDSGVGGGVLKVPNGSTSQVLEGGPFGQSGLMSVTELDQIK